jgi:hypothetical protein
MARVRKSELAFDAITLEGSLISPAKLAAVAERKATEQTDADYHILKGLTLRDETARYFRIGQALFRGLFAGAHPSQHSTVRFTHELLRDVFGFTDIEPVSEPRVRGDRTYILSLEALKGRVPVVVVPPADDLDHASANLSHDRRRSAASSLQDWLNAEDNALWGLCCNGERLRLLRDNQSLTRPAYLEANLRQIFESEDFAGFAALWLMVHASRFGQPGSPATDCALERWRESGSKEGLAARDRLSIGVKEALLALGNGFLSHPANSNLRDRLTGGQLALPVFFNELLRLVYRLIFLLAAEDRSLLHPPDAPEQARKLYADGYSIGALRDRAIRRSGWDQFHDRWEGLLIIFRALAQGEPRLGLPALGGLFEHDATPSLDSVRLSNRALMEAIFRLAWLRDDSVIVPVNWRDMETEELGSVYEGLLELTPRLTLDGRGFAFAEGVETKGNERKKSGSYYTPDSLVQALLDTALDPVLDRVESEAEDASAALLGVTVIDPACGSGHFLLAAARRIATRIARARTGGVPSAADYRHALRDAVRCCVHGVDRNPMAVELARVALWIETVEPGKPLGFLDTNIRLGDSLLGIFSLDALRKGIPDAAYKPLTGDHKPTAHDFSVRNKRDKGEAAGILDFSGRRTQTVELPPLAASLRAVRELPEDTVQQIRTKRDRFQSAHADPRLVNLAQAADLYVAAFLTPKTESQSLDLQTSLVPTTSDVWTAMRSGTVYGPRLGAARQLALKARAFHWPLEFPDVMASGGFDIVLGNPPWEVMQLGEEEYFAQHWPEIAELAGAARKREIEKLRLTRPGIFAEYEAAKRGFEASNEFARESGRFDLTASGKVNTFALFAEAFTNLRSHRGRAGVIVPTGIAVADGNKGFFNHLIESEMLVSLLAFYETRHRFIQTDDKNSFCLMTVGKASDPPEFVFDAETIEDISDQRKIFRLSPSDIELINPNTKTAPVFRSRFDAELTAKIYARVPVLLNKAAGESGNPWSIDFRQGLFNMTLDSGLFRLAEQLREAGYIPQGTHWVFLLPEPTLIDTAQSGQLGLYDGVTSAPERYVPLYEAKLIHQFDHRWATYEDQESRDVNEPEKRSSSFEPTVRYWVPENAVIERLITKGWNLKWLLGWRDITRNSDVRTVIASVLPAFGVGNNLPLIFVSEAHRHLIPCLLSNLSTLTLDYFARHKVGGIHLNFFIFEQLPVLPPQAYGTASSAFILQRALELIYTSHSLAPFARDFGYDGPPFAWDEDRRAILRAELDAWYARAYGLTLNELRFILDPADVMGSDYPSETFRVLKNNEIRKYGKYRTRDLVLEAWARMEAGNLPAPIPYDRNSTVLEPVGVGVNPLFGAGPLFEIPEAAPVVPPAYTVPSMLPDGAWVMPAYNNISVQLQLTAILKKLQGPTPADRVRLAALYALRPDYLTNQLSGAKRNEWLRFVGNSARVSDAANVISFAPRANSEWRDAYTQLRGMRALIEDPENDTWAPGATVQDFMTEGWPDGRAGFVLNALEGIVIDRSIALLPTDVQAWVRGHAA